MRVAIRADASVEIGGGHVMRCLTLADTLAAQGARIVFLAATMPEALAGLLGAACHRLTMLGDGPATEPADAAACLLALGDAQPDWIIVDHYALGGAWERALRASGAAVLSIDDLADRTHDCDLLLDMTLGRSARDYAGLTPASCEVLAGPKYAPVAKAFAAARTASLARREASEMPASTILISLGQMDHGGHTAMAARAAAAHAPLERIDVVFGSTTAPSLPSVRKQAAHDPRVVIHEAVDASAMAGLMAAADLAIGAAGTTSWERCCVGLPAIAVVLADNQRMIVRGLQAAGAARLGSLDELELARQIGEMASDPPGLQQMAEAAAAVTDGQGARRIESKMAQVQARRLASTS